MWSELLVGDSLVVSIIWQAAACVLVALFVSLALRRRPARAHFALVLGLSASLLVPVFSATGRMANLGVLARPDTAAATRPLPAAASRAEPTPQLAAAALAQRAPSTTALRDPGHAVAAHKGADQSERLASGLVPQVMSHVPNRPPEEPIERRAQSVVPWSTMPGIAWAACSALLLVRLLVSQRAAKRILSAADRSHDPRLDRALREAARRVGVAADVEVLSSSAARSPLIWCWGRRPRVIVPPILIEAASSETLIVILCHELAHRRRRDHVSTLIGELARCAWPWNPFVWLAGARMRRMSELACDDWVIVSGHERDRYARTLLSLTPQRAPALAMAAVGSRHGLVARVRNIMSSHHRVPQIGRRWLVLVAAAGLAVTSLSALAHRRMLEPVPQPGPNDQETGGSAPAVTEADAQRWLLRIDELPGNWQRAFRLGEDLAALPAAQSVDLIRALWPHIDDFKAKQQLLKAANVGRLERRHDIFHLGATDRSMEVQNWAFDFVQPVAFRDFTQDFQAYQDWYKRYANRPTDQVAADHAIAFVERLATMEANQRAESLVVLRTAGRTFRESPEARQAAIDNGLLDVMAEWIADPQADRDTTRAAFEAIQALKPDEAYLRRVVLPAALQSDNAELQASALSVLGAPENRWAIEPLLKVITDYLDQDERSSGHWFAAQALAEIGDPKVIPIMIGVIVADNSYETLYGVGYFGLSKLTGVEYHESHDGPWWREWWGKNRLRFPDEVRTVEIPQLQATPKGAGVVERDHDNVGARVPDQDLLAGGDINKHYFLVGPRDISNPPAAGYKLLLVLPGGDGGPDFHPFVTNIFSNALSDEYLLAQLVAPRWSADQAESIVWPTKTSPWKGMKFSTEEFIEAVVEDVRKRYSIDASSIFTLSWSSGGPAAYAASLAEKTPITGSLVAMSVFKPDQLPDLKAANGKAYYILHSPEDFIKMTFPKDAQAKLAAAGAATKFVTYEGGHGWHGDVFGNIRAGIQWLEEQSKR